MKNLCLTTLFLSLCLIIPKVYAFGLDEIELQEISSSKNTVIISRGLLDNYTANSFAKFFIQSGDYHFPKIFLVAEGRLIKSDPKSSTWYLSKIFLPEYIDSKIHLLVLNTNQVTQGRSMRAAQKHVVIPAAEYQTVDEFLSENKNNVPDRFLQDSGKFEESNELYDSTDIEADDLLVTTYEHSKKKGGTQISDAYEDKMEEQYFLGNRKVRMGDIKNAEDKKLLDSIAAGLVKKINSQKFSLSNGLYKDQKKEDGVRDLNSKISITSVYDKEKEDAKYREQISPRALAKIERDGNLWSGDMDDEHLRRYFIRTGLEHEERRRSLALNELDGNEVMFHYSGSMVNHTTSEVQNYRNLGYSLGLGYDLHLSRTSSDLKNLSLQFVLEKGKADYDLGGINARGEETFYGVYLNYYLINNPLTLNSFILLAGIGLKTGTVDMTNDDLSKKYTYQVLTLPSLQAMTKYRFRTGDLQEDTVNLGASLNAGINIDSKKMSAVEALDDEINGSLLIKDIKYLVGMSVYF